MVTLLNSPFPFIHKLTFYLAHIFSLPLPTFHTCFPHSKTYPCSLLWFISVNSISKLGKLVWDCFMSCNASWSRGVGGHSDNWQQVRSDPWFHVTYQPVLASWQSWRLHLLLPVCATVRKQYWFHYLFMPHVSLPHSLPSPAQTHTHSHICIYTHMPIGTHTHSYAHTHTPMHTHI